MEVCTVFILRGETAEGALALEEPPNEIIRHSGQCSFYTLNVHLEFLFTVYL